MKLAFSLTILVIELLALGCAHHRFNLTEPAPAALTATVRQAVPGDYLRVSFLPASVKVTSLSRPGALRAFASATPMFLPPLKLAEFPSYSGLANDDENVLVAMRCRPQNPEAVDAVLATWPNVFLAIQRDVPLDPSACKTESADVATQVGCFARAFTDSPQAVVPTSLAHGFSYAGKLYDQDHSVLAKWLQDNYGIFPAFSGMGFSVKDSYSISSQPMTFQQILVNSISSEYLLKNVPLSDAGCRCISVAPYPGRSNDRIDPDFIDKAGGYGVCRPVERLIVNFR